MDYTTFLLDLERKKLYELLEDKKVEVERLSRQLNEAQNSLSKVTKHLQSVQDTLKILKEIQAATKEG